jgi:aryl-alcohol dehydrogenase-like predicted oxidoreductase
MPSLQGGPPIPGLDKPISRLAQGTGFFTGDKASEWFALLDAFVASGGTLIDSARSYGDSETVLGAWMDAHGTRDRITIMTKCAHGEGIIPQEGFAKLVRDELTLSLRELKTDHVDVFFVHRDNQEMPVCEIVEPLNEEVAKGRVRVLAASNWEYRRLIEANDFAHKHSMKGFAVVSNHITLAMPAAAFYPGLISTDRHGEQWHRETGIPLVPWASQARGYYTGRYTREMRDNPDRFLPSDDTVRSDNPAFGTTERAFALKMLKLYCTDENLERLARAQALGVQKGGYTAVEVALAWLLHKRFPLVPIVGPRTPVELASCLKAVSLALSEQEIRWLNLEQ